VKHPDEIQGRVVPVRVLQDGASIWLCDECEAVRPGAERPVREATTTFGDCMAAKGHKGLWHEIEVLEPAVPTAPRAKD